MQRFLVIQTAFIGDVILALPVAQALRRAYPEAEIHMLVRRGNEGLLSGHPAVHRVWVWDKRQKYRSLFSNIRTLRQYRFEAVINLHRFITSGLVTALLRTRQRIGFDKNPLAWTYTHRLPHLLDQPGHPKPQHEVDRNLSLLRPLLGALPRERPRLYPSEEDTQAAKAAAGGTWPLPYVVMAPTSVWFTKQWPLSQWQKLVEALPPEMTVLLIGAAADHPALEQLRKGIGSRQAPLHNLAGRLTLLQSAALMAGASRVFANDSAPLHLASAMNAPSTAIFCSTVPAFGFGPLADDAAVMEVEGLACRPCGLHGRKACPEGHFRCALQIDPYAVAKTIGPER